MLDDDTTSPPQTIDQQPAAPPRRTRRRAASRPAGPPQPVEPTPMGSLTESDTVSPGQAPAAAEGADVSGGLALSPTEPETQPADAPANPPATRSRTRKSADPTKSTTRSRRSAAVDPTGVLGSGETQTSDAPAAEPLDTADAATMPDPSAATGAADGTPRRSASRKTRKTTQPPPVDEPATPDDVEIDSDEPALDVSVPGDAVPGVQETVARPVALLFQAPDPVAPPSRRATGRQRDRGGLLGDAAAATSAPPDGDAAGPTQPAELGDSEDVVRVGDEPVAGSQSEDDGASSRRRRSRGGRNRRKAGDTDKLGETSVQSSDDKAETSSVSASATDADAGARTDDDSASSHRRRRRRRSSEDSADTPGDPTPTVVRVREPRPKKESISSVEGSTRIEAKKQRRREGREAGRRRPPILSESEFLARRESVERVMAIRQRGEITQIGVLEDDVLVEHYVALESQNSLIGNVYLGRVQNVLPSMEAAFIDIGKGRNAVLYAGEVDWALLGGNNQPRRIENALKPGQTLLVQVSKDPVGHKGARLTSQISLPGRYLVYVPHGGTSGISRKLPDVERNRLKNLLKDIIDDSAGVIIRTAAEGASEDELTRDVTRLTARWEDIEKKVKTGQAPALLYGEPDTTIKVVRDLFTEDFARLVISGDDAWDMVDGYVQHVAPDLADRLERYEGDGDIFVDLRIQEQIAKALDRKVWLPSGGSLVIDRTEAMTVVDVNTGKFTGSGGNLEETVTKNNLEAAEEMVRQLRLRDIGGIIVIDFIDMVLEHNRDLVLRRLVECLGRDRTRHQVAEVTSLGLVQMTRKRISTGLIEAFSHPCEVCQGRGVVIDQEPEGARQPDDSHVHHGGPGSAASRSSKRSSNRRRGGQSTGSSEEHPSAGADRDVPAAELSDSDSSTGDSSTGELSPGTSSGPAGSVQTDEVEPVASPV